VHATMTPQRLAPSPGPIPGDADAPASGESKASRWRAPGLDALFTAVFALFGFGVGIERLSDNSFFTHLATGRWILEHGIPRADVYSFTAPGTKWVAQSWLAEVLYAQLDETFGAFGIRVLGALTGAAITVLTFRLALRLACDRVRAALVSVAALAGLYTLWSERPLLLGVLFLVVLLWIVEVPDCPAGRRPLVALPVLFWVWANVHGTFALGFAYLGLHIAGRWLDGARPWEGRERLLLIGSTIAGALTFLNPYGPDLVFFPLHLLGRGDILRHVIEWASPNFHDVRGQSFLLWLAVFVGVVARGRYRVSRRDLVVTVPFLLLALWALRNVAIAPLVGLPVVSRALAVEPDGERRRSDDGAGRRPLGWVLAALLAVIACGLVVRAANQPDFVTRPYPVRAMQALEDRGLIGTRLLMDDGDAAYAELRYFPEQKVFIDDRYDMYPTEVIYDFFTLADAAPGWRRVLAKYDVETVVWERDRPLVQYLRQSGDWTQIHRDRTWVTLVRNDLL
jgi:hypothetical protein